MRNRSATSRRQRGWSLVIVMVIMAIATLVGVAAIRLSMGAERSARADRDMQVAWQSAEAGLMDAEFDIFGPGTSSRRSKFGDRPDLSVFLPGCGASGDSKGLCEAVTKGKPAWLTVDLAAGNSAEFGDFTLRTFHAGAGGLRPSAEPRYVIEPIRDPAFRDLGNPEPKYIYRITAMGFGPRGNQAVLQTLYRL